MVAVTTFYIDDSGTRHPDHLAARAAHGYDWFALGGILINDEDIPGAKQLIAEFRRRWPQMEDAPLHSVEIRGRYANFKWLGVGDNTRERFLTDLEALLFALPVIGLGCVIDRPGYNSRYREKYGRQRWALCKTAFAVVVERATKYALQRERKLRIFVEQTDKVEDRIIGDYYDTLRRGGHWFNPVTSGKYNPVTRDDYKNTLYEFRTKKKTSPLIQIADLYLWPICMGGYDIHNYSYSRLLQAGKLINCVLPPEDVQTQGLKYSCFDDINS
ncbi:MAG: DUF3800 domain-containing protein [Thiobacillus sp.]